MIIHVEVTAMDIEYGVSRYNACPIALAVRRLGFKNVLVGKTWVRTGRTTGRKTSLVRYYPVDRDAMSAFVTAFDKGEKTEPFTLALRKE